MKKLTLTMTIMLIATLASIAQIPYKGLVAFFPFTGNYNDISGSGITLEELSAKPVLTEGHTGIANTAYMFNGMTQAFKATTNKLPLGNSDLTISAWVNYINGSFSAAPIVSWGNNSPNQKSEVTFYFTTKNLDPYIGLTNGVDSIIYKAPWNTTNHWHHFAVTIKNGSVIFYNNGIASPAQTISTDIKDGGLFGIAARWDSPYSRCRVFGGKIDDLAIYNRALTDQEIKYIKDCNSTIQVKVLPKITSTPITVANVNQKYVMKVETTGANSIVLQTKPTGMNINNSTIEWTPAAYQVGTNSVKIVAKNEDGDSTTLYYTINVIPPTSVINTVMSNRSITKSQKQTSYSLDGRKIKQNNNIRGLILNQNIKRLIVK